jgi:formate dehydrogenase subunit beta
MSKILKVQGNVEDALRNVLRDLLESGRVKAVFAPRGPDQDGVTHSLVTHPSSVEQLLPFYPLMPAQGAAVLSHLTATAPFTEPIAACLRPCELRACVELVKRGQGSLENILLISCTCPGVYPLKASLDGGIGPRLGSYWEAVARNEIADDIRPACASCVEFLPYEADMAVVLAGADHDLGSSTHIALRTALGEEVGEALDGEIGDGTDLTEASEALRAKRQSNRDTLSKEISDTYPGLDGLIDFFGRCIGCRGCREVCPICYCGLCEFESDRRRATPMGLEADLRQRGGMRLPAGTLDYHLGRMAHMAFSCVACGQCTDVCPADIPVSTMYSKIGEAIREQFHYVPGRDVEEPIPLKHFVPEELAEVED